MTFPLELKRTDKGLVFKLNEKNPAFSSSTPLIVEARALGDPFDVTFEDRTSSLKGLYSGSPRYEGFLEQMQIEINRRGLDSDTANAYLILGPEVGRSPEKTIYGEHLPIRRPTIMTQRIQLYNVDGEVAEQQWRFLAAFVAVWSS